MSEPYETVGGLVSEVFKDCRYDPETGYAYNPNTGQLWRIKEIETTKTRLYDERIISAKINCPGNYAKVVTHVIWKIMTGSWPKLWIDHINGIVEDMSWNNLREATPQQNAANRNSPGRWNNTDINLAKGVYKERNRYAVNIGQQYYGRFDTVEEANAVAEAKRKELYGEFGRNT